MEIPKTNDADECFNELLVQHIQHGDNDKVMSILQNSNPSQLTNSSGATLLHVAATYGNAWLAQHLMDLGANVDALNDSQETPLMLAIENEQLESVKVLLGAKADLFVPDLQGECALSKALDKEILVNTDVEYNINLSADRIKNFYSISDALLKSVTSESLKNSRHVDSKFHTQCPLYYFIPLKNMEVIRILLEKGSPVDAKNQYGDTLLHIAVENMDFENVMLLLEYKADVNIKNNVGKTPMNYLGKCTDQNKTLQMFQILIAAGATLIDYESNKIFVKVLLSRGDKEVVRCVLKHKIDLHFMDDDEYQEEDENGYTALHYLAENRNPDVLTELHGYDFDVNIRSKNSKCTMLHCAAFHGNANSIQFLVDHGADVKATCRYDDTPLNWLVNLHNQRNDRLDDYVKCVEILLARGADPQIVTEKNVVYQTRMFQRAILDYCVKVMQHVLAYLPMVELSGREITRNMQTTILSIPQFKKVFDSKKIELEEMKQINLGKSVTLLDFLMADDEKISLYARNRSFTTASFSELKKDVWESCYQRKLDTNFSKWTEFVESRMKAAMVIDEILVELYNTSVYTVAEKIIDYLEDHELTKLL